MGTIWQLNWRIPAFPRRSWPYMLCSHSTGDLRIGSENTHLKLSRYCLTYKFWNTLTFDQHPWGRRPLVLSLFQLIFLILTVKLVFCAILLCCIILWEHLSVIKIQWFCQNLIHFLGQKSLVQLPQYKFSASKWNYNLRWSLQLWILKYMQYIKNYILFNAIIL